MPEPLDRAEFLRKVADSVDLQPSDVGDVVEELNSHLSDAAAGWRDAGYDVENAERRAVRGLGDPEALGKELGRARHERRQLLAGVGGGVFNAVVFGLWAFLFLWLVVGGLALIGLLATVAVAQRLDWQTGSWLTGPSGSVATVAITTMWFAWVGWSLPWRVARSARRSVTGVQRAVGVAGLVVGTWALWTWVSVDMDPVLAIGLPLGPVAFLVASQHPVDGPYLFPRTTLRARTGVALTIVLATVVLAVATVSPGVAHPDWESDLRAFNVNTNGVDGIEYALTISGRSRVEVLVEDPAHASEFAARYPTLSIEAWPSAVADGRLIVGPEPIATQSAQTSGDTAISLDLPMSRSPVDVSVIVVAVATDGTRVLLNGPDGPGPTPGWHGTLFEWWFGPR